MGDRTRRDFLRWTASIGGFGLAAIGWGKWTESTPIARSATVEPPIAPPSLPFLQNFEFETVTLDPSGFVIDRARRSALYYIEEKAGLEMIDIPGGTFLMGTPEGEKSDFTGADKPQHPVTIAGFYLSKYPITQGQWKAVAGLPKIDRELNPDPSHFKGENLPVETVSWEEAIEFCQRLSKATGRNYQLPSEARWEYACRAGTTTPFSFGVTLTSQYANYFAEKNPFAVERESEFRSKTVPVGSFPPNAFGLHDLHGSVYEWCADSWHRNYENAPGDGEVWPVEPNSTGNHYRVLRGGGWGTEARECRSASRGQFPPNQRFSVIGFRVAMIS